MPTVNPYLYFNGTCEEAFHFYQAVFQKKITYLSRYSEVPATERSVFKETEDKIMHVTLPISAETVLMGSDNTSGYNEQINYDNFALMVHAVDKTEADRLLQALSSGGLIELPLKQTFWGSYYGICVDKFGIRWKVSASEH